MTEDDRLRRWLLFQPCSSQEELSDWIFAYLGLRMPDCIVDPASNSTPMDMIWFTYSKCLENDEDFAQVLFYASRDSFKTLAASIIEVLGMFHLGRSVAHLAAVLTQSTKAQSYLKKFLRRPTLSEFLVGDAQRSTSIVWYTNHATGDILTKKEYESLQKGKQISFTPASTKLTDYAEYDEYINVLVATLAGVNSEHVLLLCVDGDTKLAVRVDAEKRDRKSHTARGVFRRLEGRSHGGRPCAADQLPKAIESPACKVEMLGINPNTGALEFSPIIRAQRSIQSTVEISTETKKIICTLQHPLLTTIDGYKQAGDLGVGDRLVVVNRAHSFRGTLHKLGPQQSERTGYASPIADRWEQVLLGTLLGDCGIYRRPMANAYVQMQHCAEQADYLRWKISVLSEKLRFSPLKDPRSGYTGTAQVGFRSGNSPLLNQYAGVRDKLDLIDRLGPLGLAVWFMDDGCVADALIFSTEGWDREENERLRQMLSRSFGIDVEVERYTRDDKTFYRLRGGVEAKRRMAEVCGEYILPAFDYKINVDRNKKKCSVCEREFWFYERNATYVNNCGAPVCVAIAKGTFCVEEIVSVRDAGIRTVYDFTLANNHNYISNGLVSHNCIDEVEVVKQAAVMDEARNIPAPKDGKLPVTVLTSTRKFRFGFVQKEIDNAAKTGTVVKHWNIIDVTQRCPETRHLPHLPKLPIYSSVDRLHSCGQAEFDALPDGAKSSYTMDEGYDGCLSKCKIFFACKGRLATEQKSTSKLLRPIATIQNKFRTFATNVQMAKAQLLCLNPESTGLVYPRFSSDVHVISPDQAYRRIWGEDVAPEHQEKAGEGKMRLSKARLIDLLEPLGVRWVAGVDFGSTHPFAYIHGFVYGGVVFITHVFAAPGLDPEQTIKAVEQFLKYNPDVWGDPENPQLVKVMKKAGFNMKKWKKGPGSVAAGISIVQGKMFPPFGEKPEFYIVRDIFDDPQIDLAIEHLQEYHYKLDAAGVPTDIPDEENDDIPDGIRYLVMNATPTRVASALASAYEEDEFIDVPVRDIFSTAETVYHPTEWMKQVVSEMTGEEPKPHSWDNIPWPTAADAKGPRRSRGPIIDTGD